MLSINIRKIYCDVIYHLLVYSLLGIDEKLILKFSICLKSVS
jgi:hypothetical protein